MSEDKSATTTTLTIRLIRSFPHRNIKHFIIRNVDSESVTVSQLMDRVRSEIVHCKTLPPPFRTFAYDCMKIEHKAHGAKTTDPVIRLDDNDDRFVLNDLEKTLSECRVENETEISFFRRSDYEEYKANPSSVQW